MRMSIKGVSMDLKEHGKEDGKQRWTSSWTNCTPSPSGHIYFYEQVWPYQINYQMRQNISTHYNSQSEGCEVVNHQCMTSDDVWSVPISHACRCSIQWQASVWRHHSQYNNLSTRSACLSRVYKSSVNICDTWHLPLLRIATSRRRCLLTWAVRFDFVNTISEFCLSVSLSLHVHRRRQLWGTGARAPWTYNCLIFQVTSEPNSDVRLCVVACTAKNTQTCRFDTVYCMNLTIFLCVVVKLFPIGFVTLLAPNPGDATVHVIVLFGERNARDEHCCVIQDSWGWAIAKKTARCAQYMGALKSFESPHYAPGYFSRNL